MALLAITNPVGTTPIFLGLTQSMSLVERQRIARTAALSVAIILTFAILAGESILGFFGIGIPAFRISAGILILMIALDMIHARVSRAKQSPREAAEAEERDTVGIVPLAIPLTAGPGTISVVIAFEHRSSDWIHTLAAWLIALAVAVCLWVLLRVAVKTARLLSETGLNVFTRVMGLILAAVAVEFVVEALAELFPAWTAA